MCVFDPHVHLFMTLYYMPSPLSITIPPPPPQGKRGLIVRKEWVLDSYSKGKRLPAKKLVTTFEGYLYLALVNPLYDDHIPIPVNANRFPCTCTCACALTCKYRYMHVVTCTTDNTA